MLSTDVSVGPPSAALAAPLRAAPPAAFLGGARASGASEPFFAVKIGSWSWFCLWGDESSQNDRGMYSKTRQDSEPSASELSPEPSEAGSNGYTRPRRIPGGESGGNGCIGGTWRSIERALTWIALFEIPFFERHREMVLLLSSVLTVIGILCTSFSFFAALLSGPILEIVSWIMVFPASGPGTAGKSTYLGIREYCQGQLLDLRCEKLENVDCEAVIPNHATACERCKTETQDMFFPMLIASLMYFNIAWSACRRHVHDKETKIGKARLVGGAICGGFATLYSMTYYRFSCGRLASDLADHGGFKVLGPGFIMMGIATLAKIVIGVLHFGLPVQSEASKLGRAPNSSPPSNFQTANLESASEVEAGKV